MDQKNQIAIKTKNKEVAVSKPSVVSEGKKISIYFSARGKYYKIFKVTSKKWYQIWQEIRRDYKEIRLLGFKKQRVSMCNKNK